MVAKWRKCRAGFEWDCGCVSEFLEFVGTWQRHNYLTEPNIFTVKKFSESQGSGAKSFLNQNDWAEENMKNRNIYYMMTRNRENRPGWQIVDILYMMRGKRQSAVETS